MAFILLTQPQGQLSLINLDNVIRMFPADKGGTGIVFIGHNADFKNNGSVAIYQESFEDIKRIMGPLIPVNSNATQR